MQVCGSGPGGSTITTVLVVLVVVVVGYRGFESSSHPIPSWSLSNCPTSMASMAEKLRTATGCDGLPIIFLSANVDQMHIDRGREMGAV